MQGITTLYQHFLSSGGVTTDTRNISQGSIFFALKGEKFNANLFAAEALDKGAAYAIVDEIANEAWKAKYGDRLIKVDDVLQSLQQLAGYHRQQLKCPVLAITGSNGKTTTKELIAAVLSKKFKVYATKGNLNNHIGIPLTLLSIKGDVEFAVIEMGANHQGEIASYCEYVNPGYGLITNVGLAHTEGFGGFEGVVKGKTELYRYIAVHGGKVFVSADNEILLEKSSAIKERITYGKARGAFCQGSITGNGEFLCLTASSASQAKEISIQTNLIGEYNFENVMSAVCVGKYFGIGIEKIKAAIENYTPTNNRSQRIVYGTNTIILDAYNANPSSMSEALKNFEKTEAKNKIVILGEMMELGKYADEEHRKIKAMVEGMPLDKRVFVGGGFSFLKTDPGVMYFETTADLKTWFKKQNFQESYILIKGSRKNELEKILSD